MFFYMLIHLNLVRQVDEGPRVGSSLNQSSQPTPNFGGGATMALVSIGPFIHQSSKLYLADLANLMLP